MRILKNIYYATVCEAFAFGSDEITEIVTMIVKKQGNCYIDLEYERPYYTKEQILEKYGMCYGKSRIINLKEIKCYYNILGRLKSKYKVNSLAKQIDKKIKELKK